MTYTEIDDQDFLDTNPIAIALYSFFVLQHELIEATLVMHGRGVFIEELQDLLQDWMLYYEELDLNELFYFSMESNGEGSIEISIIGKTEEAKEAFLEFEEKFGDEF